MPYKRVDSCFQEEVVVDDQFVDDVRLTVGLPRTIAIDPIFIRDEISKLPCLVIKVVISKPWKEPDFVIHDGRVPDDLMRW
jgi:hypothetical protein